MSTEVNSLNPIVITLMHQVVNDCVKVYNVYYTSVTMQFVIIMQTCC